MSSLGPLLQKRDGHIGESSAQRAGPSDFWGGAAYVRESQDNLGWEEPDITYTPMLSSMQQQLPSPVRSLTSNFGLKVFKGWNPSTLSNSLHSPSIIFKGGKKKKKKRECFLINCQNFLFWNLFLLRAMYFWENSGAVLLMTSSRWTKKAPLSAFCLAGQSDSVISPSLYVTCIWRDVQIKNEHPKALEGLAVLALPDTDGKSCPWSSPSASTWLT